MTSYLFVEVPESSEETYLMWTEKTPAVYKLLMNASSIRNSLLEELVKILVKRA